MIVSKSDLFIQILKFLWITLNHGFQVKLLILMVSLLQISLFVDLFLISPPFFHIEYQIGFSVVKTVRTKQNNKRMCMQHQNDVQYYLNDKFFSSLKLLSSISMNTNNFVVLMYISRMELKGVLIEQFLIFQTEILLHEYKV